MTDHIPAPFGARGVSRRTWLSIGGGLLLTAAIVFLLLPRRAPVAEAPAAGHVHGAAGVSGPGEMPVTLGERDQARIGITFAPVQWGPLDREVRAVAQVKVDETEVRSVAPLVEGWVEELAVAYTGQAVRAGDPLFRLYAPMVVAAEQELILAQRLGGEVEGGTADARRGAAELLDAARRRLRYWGVPEEEIRRVERTGEAGRSVLFRSAYSGVVTEKFVTQGQRLMPGEVAYRIADLRRVWLEGEVFEQDLSAVRLGQMVRADFTALPGVTRTGRVTYVYPTVDPVTRTVRIRVELANPGMLLKPGMYATIRFSTRGAATLSVPRSAVLSTGERNLVFVRSRDRFIPKLVVVGSATDDRVEIRSGLVRGDTVVASGTFLLDAESNLGSLLGGMGNMPGMDMGPPVAPDPVRPRVLPGPATPATPVPPARDTQSSMPGMDHSTMTMPE